MDFFDGEKWLIGLFFVDEENDAQQKMREKKLEKLGFRELENGYFTKEGKNNTFSLFSPKFKKVSKETFKKIVCLGVNLFKVLKNGLWGVIDHKGEWVVPTTCRSIGFHTKRKLLVITNKQGRQHLVPYFKSLRVS